MIALTISIHAIVQLKPESVTFWSPCKLSKVSVENRDRLILQKDEDGRCSLHHAVLDGSSGLAGLLIEAISVKNKTKLLSKRDKNGSTALHYASLEGDVANMEVILSNAGKGYYKDQLILSKNKDGDTALLCAYTEGHNEAVQIILDHISDNKRDALLMMKHPK